MIVKIQRAIVGENSVLIYNKSRTVQLEGTPTPEIDKALGADLKGYFKAQIIGSNLKLGKRVSAQSW